MIPFGLKLDRLMKARGLSKADTARIAEVDQSRLLRCMKGESNPTAPQVFAWAKYFAVSMEYLVDDAVPVDAADSMATSSPVDRAVIRMFRSLVADEHLSDLEAAKALERMERRLKAPDQAPGPRIEFPDETPRRGRGKPPPTDG